MSDKEEEIIEQEKQIPLKEPDENEENPHVEKEVEVE